MIEQLHRTIKVRKHQLNIKYYESRQIVKELNKIRGLGIMGDFLTMKVTNFRSVFEKENSIVEKMNMTDDMLRVFVAEDKSTEMRFMDAMNHYFTEIGLNKHFTKHQLSSRAEALKTDIRLYSEHNTLNHTNLFKHE
jgi:hypothetical protein